MVFSHLKRLILIDILPVTASTLGGNGLAPWPARMNAPPARLKELGFSEKTFNEDTVVAIIMMLMLLYLSFKPTNHSKLTLCYWEQNAWKKRVEVYVQKLREAKQMEDDSFRNVMDMNANFGGFAAALHDAQLPVWVMNVVPNSGPSTLKIVYDRGFIGSYHDWYEPLFVVTYYCCIYESFLMLILNCFFWNCRCDSYSTYPRTYDLLHAWSVFSDVYNRDCSPTDLLLEMDRLLRPKGVVIIRDTGPIIDEIRKQLNPLHWNLWSDVFDATKDAISDADEKILIARKQLWQPEDIM